MSKVIWKYALTGATTKVSFPRGGQILSVRMQSSNIPAIWVLCNPTADSETHLIKSIPTGESINEVGQYLGTVESSNRLVWHIFDMGIE